MNCLFGRVHGDCEACAAWSDRFDTLARCKIAHGAPAGAKCFDLGFDRNYFEPNPASLEHWRETHGLYKPDIDRGVMFVCESPLNPKRPRPWSLPYAHPCKPTHPDHKLVLSPTETVPIQRPWDRRNPNAYKLRAAISSKVEVAAAARNRLSPHFFEAPDDSFAGLFEDFRHAVITNVVKCGPGEDGGDPSRVVSACATAHLRKEIELFEPLVIVVVGPSTTRKWFDQFANTSERRRRRVIYHYADRGATARTLKDWTETASAIKGILDSIPTNSRWWHDWWHGGRR